MRKYVQAQRELCERYGATWVEAPEHLKVGIAVNVKSGLMPLNGLRHPPAANTTGWYIWAGPDFPLEDDEFFVPMHMAHLQEVCPLALEFLGLPPGWRFLTDGGHVDVWVDPSLLEV